MNTDTNVGYLSGIITELRKLPAETGWVEFKENNANPQDIQRLCMKGFYNAGRRLVRKARALTLFSAPIAA